MGSLAACLRVPFLIAAGAVVACSGNAPRPSGSGARPPDPGLDLLVDTATGSDVAITGRLSMVVLEGVDGVMTGDLLPGDPEVRLSDPFGAMAGLRLLAAPPNRYAAVHLLFAADELVGVLPNQTRIGIALPRRDFRLAFARSFEVAAGPQSWMTLRHVGPIDLVAQGNTFSWTPTWVAEAADVELVNDGEVLVLGLDRARQRVDGELVSAGGMPVALDLSRAADLRRDGRVLDVAAFLAALRPGESVRIRGWLDAARTVHVFAASVYALGPPLSEVRGEIVEIAAAARTARVLVFEIRRDLYGLPTDRPLQLQVEFGPRTAVQWVPCDGAPPGPVPFADLRVGMLVSVAWEDAAQADRVLAARVEIFAASRTDVPVTYTGLITSVDVALARFVLSSAGQTSFRLGDQRHPTLLVDVDHRTLLFRRVGEELRALDVRDLPRGSRASVCVVPIAGDHVRSLLVRVE